MTNEDTTHAIQRLTKAQRATLDQLCCGHQGGHPKVLAALVKLGLAEPYETELPGWPTPVTVNHIIPIAVHVAWAQLCTNEQG